MQASDFIHYWTNVSEEHITCRYLNSSLNVSTLQTNFVFRLSNECAHIPTNLFRHFSIGLKSKQNCLVNEKRNKGKGINLNFRRR